MRFAIAGLGGAARRAHLPTIAALAPHATLAAAADPNPRSRHRLEEVHPGVPTFASAQEMLGSIACDVLVVATSPQAHAQLVTDGMRYGRHVVCEKPLTITRSDHSRITAACARRPDLALVPVHQYRHSAQWGTMARWIRAAIIAKRPYSLTVDIQRPGTDPHATSAWRSDLTQSGGMLADSGVHFLALAWRLHHQLELITARRHVNASGHEDSTATHRLGSGTVTIHACNGAAVRATRLRLHVGAFVIVWHDDVARLEIAQRAVRRRRVDALSDRAHVDTLYRPLYRDLLDHLGARRWRAHRTLEALAVTDTLITLLEHAPVSR